MDRLIVSYQERLQLEGARFTRIEHKDAFVAIVYKITVLDGSEWILKICPRPHDYLREEYFLKRLAGVIRVPKIVRVVPAEGELKGAVLMECLPGRPMTGVDIDKSIAYEMGECLARIHLNRVSGYGDLIEGSNLSEDPCPRFVAKFEEGLEECAVHMRIVLVNRVRNYMEAHKGLLKDVDGPCIVHRDFRPGNLLIHDGKLTGVIDWAGARGSFAEEDFCTLEHGEWGIGDVSKVSFFEGYKSVRPVPKYRALMPLLRLNRVVAMTGFMVREGTFDARDRASYERNLKFLESYA